MDATETLPKSETEVLVVGAGPTGLMMACELLRRGVRCRVVDESDAPSRTSKALGIQPRTLEVFESMGIVERFLAEGTRTTGVNVHHGEERILRMDTGNLKAPYPYVLALPQSETERLLTERLRELGGEVERSRELVGFGQEEDLVVAWIKDLGRGATEKIRAGWLVGCDGAHSQVRHTLGVPFEGSAYEEEFLLADVDLDWSRSHDEAHAWLHADGIFGVLPLPSGHQWRLISDVTPQDGEEPPTASVELFQRLMAERTGDTKTRISNPTWLSNFRISRRMVTGYRKGRVFLAGDAAHIHSPFGGQGMNTGLQDAYNLGWKLALVIEGRASDSLLDTYEEERLPVARDVLKDTHASTSLLISKNPALRFARDHVLIRLLNLGFVQGMMLRENSQLKVNYRKSSLSKSYEAPLADTTLLRRSGEKPGIKDRLSFLTAPKSGDRAPQGRCLRYPSREETTLFREFEGTKFTLLLFDGPSRTAEGYANLAQISQKVEELWAEDVKTYVVIAGDDRPEDLDWDGPVLLDARRELHRTYGAGAEALYLIRPDGYIGFRSQPAREDLLLRYLGDLLQDAQAGEAGTRDGNPYTQNDPGKTSTMR